MFDPWSNCGEDRTITRHCQIQSVESGLTMVRVAVGVGTTYHPSLGCHFIQGVRFDSHETLAGGIIGVWRIKLSKTVNRSSRNNCGGANHCSSRSSCTYKTGFSGSAWCALFSFSRTIHRKLGTRKGEPITSGSDLRGISQIRSLIAKLFHPINT